ncbi:uncharacterized protein LOC119184101 isoform X2 [Rhipicephalus microplus]|uniref:uncharacterized protein LOC119184101 isoform X2 n=1 Tax=Rhipicephalus microplus TaxID=6941 RepID=UPI003F6A6B86
MRAAGGYTDTADFAEKPTSGDMRQVSCSVKADDPCACSHRADESGPNVPVRLSVLEGEPTSLPCPIDTATREPITAVWFHVTTHAYQEYGGSPHYTNGHLQARKVYAIEAPHGSSPTAAAGGSTGLVDGAHWKQPSWSGRAFFSLLSDPPALRLNRLERTDSGSYVCNVTYRDNVTSAVMVVTESRTDLFVAAQACPPSIKDIRGATLKETAGPYAEGDTARLTCEIETCDHDVVLTWYHNGTQMRSSRGTVATSDGGWKNLVTLGPFTRRDLHSNVTCQATSNVSLPGATTVLLDLYMAPTAVTVWSWPAHHTDTPPVSVESFTGATQHPLPNKSATITTTTGPGLSLLDREARYREATAAITLGPPSGFSNTKSFECEASGSRPAANVTWFLDGVAVDPELSRSVSMGNVTTSILLLPASAQSGRLLECRAINGNLPENRGVLSRFLKVDTSHKTEVAIHLGMGLNASHIVEGSDVYMECSVLAASKVIDVSWLHEGSRMKGVAGGDGLSDAFVTSRYLVIRGVTAEQSGRYTCTANTADGESVESIPLELRVRHAPRCGARRDKVLAVRPNEQVNVTCDVSADPDEGLHFFWIAEDDAGKRRHVTKTEGVTPDTQDAQSGEQLPELWKSNQLEVLIDAHLLHATLLCWARNAVGTQREPCRHRFQLRRGRGSSLDCAVGNYTDTSFSITCSRRQGHVWSGEDSGAKATKTRVRIDLFDATAGNRSVRGFWVTTSETGRDQLFLTGLKPATEYLVLVKLEMEANAFATYVRTLVPAQTLIEREELGSTENTSTLPLNDTTVLVIVCIAAAATLGVAAATGAALWFKYHRRRSRLLNAAAVLKHAEYKAYFTADVLCS